MDIAIQTIQMNYTALRSASPIPPFSDPDDELKDKSQGVAPAFESSTECQWKLYQCRLSDISIPRDYLSATARLCIARRFFGL